MTITAIAEMFPDELTCLKYMEKARWGKKTKCAYCGSINLGKRNNDFRFKCKDCKKTTSVTVNTPLHHTRIPLKTWLFAFAIISDAKKGVSALQLHRNLGISYPASWVMYHKIRNLMEIENTEIEDLEGVVEMDETYVGGKPRPFNDGTTKIPIGGTIIPELDERLKELKEAGIKIKRGRGNPAKSDINPKRGRGTNKTPVVGIVQRDGNVVAKVMQTLTHKNLRQMLQKYVDEPNAVLITDEHSGYNKIDQIIEHVKIDHQRLYSYKGINTNTIESFWALIKRQIIGQHHQVSVKYLPKYVEEVVFKYNNRKEDDMFETLVKNSVCPLS